MTKVGAGRRGLVTSTSAAADSRNRAKITLRQTISAFDNAPIMTAIVQGGNFDYCNDAFRRVFGVEGPNYGTVEVLELAMSEESPDMLAALSNLSDWNGEVAFQSADENVIRGRVRIARLEPTASKRVVIFVEDITKEWASAQQLHRAERMEVIAQLTGGVAHEFNNILNAILACAELLREEPGISEEGIDYTNDIAGVVARGAGLTQQLISFSGRQVLCPKVTTCHDLFSDFIGLLSRALGEGYQLELRRSADVVAVRCDAEQLRTAVLNLVLNSRDAQPNGGSVDIGLELHRVKVEEVLALGILAVGEYVKISVSDCGHGIDGDVVDRIWDPFMTTRPIATHSGLGLSMASGFAVQSRGGVSVSSSSSRTTVSLYLPHESVAPVAADSTRNAAGTVLYVEDNDSVRPLLTKLMTQQGYTVVSVASAGAALQELRSGNEFDVIATDFILGPDGNGLNVVAAARKRWPEIPVLYMSGYSFNDIPKDAMEESHTAFLSKPVPRLLLLSTLRTLLSTKQTLVRRSR